MALQGRLVLVQYDVGGPQLWHERQALEHVQGDNYIVLTPDGDVYMEELGLLNTDLRAVRVRPGPGILPPGIRGAQVYGLPPFSAAEMTGFEAEARRQAADERRVLGGGVAPPAAGGVPVAPVAPGVGATALLDPVDGYAAGTLKWLAAEQVEHHHYGQEVPGVTAALVKGAKAVFQLPSGASIFVTCVDGADYYKFLQRPALGDNRVLEVELNALGQPERSLKDVASLCKEVKCRWTLAGPRTSRWCINYLAVEGLGFEGHHERLRQVTRADASSWGIQEHFQVSMSLRQALLVDQLDGFNLLSIEIQFRRLQTIEYSYSEKAREQESKAVGGKLSLEEQTTFGGVTRQFSTLMVCPELLEHVKAETEKEASLAKNLRKAREEREAARRGKKGPEALMELRVSQGYEDLPTSSPLASFDPELVALPSGALSPVPLDSLVGQDGQFQVEDFTKTQTLVSDEAMRTIGRLGLGRSYEDPQFRDRSKYASFIKKLLNLGMLDLSLEEPCEKTGMFFVKKKGGKQRLIFDCRRSNCHFTTPEPIRLATGDSIGRLETSRTPLYMASADLQNAFYTMSMPYSLRKYFGLRGVKASELGIEEFEGRKLSMNQVLHPRIAVVPMGWSWAMWWCQHVSEVLCEKGGLSPDRRLRDGMPVPQGSFWHVQYVDNLHVFGTDRKEVEEHFWQAVSVLREAGLTVHEIEINEGQAEVLGWQVQESGILRPTKKRLWRVRMAIRELLRMGRASGQQLERLLGHITFVSLCRREALSVLGDCYTFVKRNYKQVVPIWKSVRKELAMWDGISVLIYNNMRSVWGDTLYAVDASEWGLGVTTTTANPSELSKLGAYVERWRFKDEAARNPRAFVQTCEEDIEVGYEESTKTFTTVGFGSVCRPWTVVGRSRWQRLEGMPVLEARATLFGIKHILRSCSNFGKRHIILTDSMTAAVAFDKGRANSYRLRRVLQQSAALSLGSGCVFRCRWPGKQVKRKLQAKQLQPPPPQQHAVPLTWDIELSRDSGKVKQSRRSARRKTVRQHKPQQTLRLASVGPQTLKKYEALWLQLVEWSGNQVTADMDKNAMDRILTAYLEFLYLEGEDLSKANYVTASVIFHVPGTKGLSTLPLTQQSMKGWRRLCPPRARMPVPFEAVCLLCQEAVRQNKLEVGLSIMMMFMLYLRPAEPFRLRVQDIVKPVGKKHRTYKHFAVLLHPNEVGVPSKTLQYDEMLTLDLKYHKFLGPSLVKHLGLGHRPAQQLAFSITLTFVFELGCSVFLEIFSGCGRLSKAVRLELGCPVLAWDITMGPQYDLTRRSNQRKILNWMEKGYIRAGHLGTPCNSFSRARDRPGGPPPLRSDGCPLGLPNLREADQTKVRIGNSLMYFSCMVLRLALMLHIAVSMENPGRSRLWICPSVKKLLSRRFTSLVDVTFCAFGTPWKKPTKIFGVHLDLSHLSCYYCRGSKRGICLFTGKPHVALMGQSNGVWRTKLAEPYPPRFCRALSKCFSNFEVSLLAAEFSRHLG
eukprot:Skav200691  [mRNA]  locus=scaffold6391:1205:6504:+ [translate_table: standard]